MVSIWTKKTKRKKPDNQSKEDKSEAAEQAAKDPKGLGSESGTALLADIALRGGAWLMRQGIERSWPNRSCSSQLIH